MKLNVILFFLIILITSQVLAQEVTVKGIVKNLPDSVEFINFSTNEGYHYMKINNGKFEFKVHAGSGKDKLYHAYFVLTKSEFPNLQNLQDALFDRSEVSWEKDPIAILIDSNQMELEIDAKEKLALIKGSQINKQNSEMQKLSREKRKIYEQKILSQEEVAKWGLAENLKIAQKYPSSLLTINYVNNLLKDPFMGAGLKQLTHGSLDTINNLIAEIKTHQLPDGSLDELLKNQDLANNRYQLKDGIPFPDIRMSTLKNKEINIKDVLNQADYIVVDFWATWCKPCLAQHPEYERIALGSKKNIKFIGISVDKQVDTWSAHLNNHPLKYDNFWFGDDTSNTLRDSLGLNSFPTYMIIESKSGKVIRAGFNIDKMEEVLATLE